MRLLDAETPEAFYHLAERYLLLGLEYNAVHCAPALLRLYRQIQEDAKFKIIWELYSNRIKYAPEDLFYQLKLLCQSSPEQALEMAQTHLYLQYLPEFLPMLIQAACKLQNTALEERFQLRLDTLNTYPAADEFEQALMDGDFTTLSQYCAQPEQLSNLGYSSQEIEIIKSTYDIGEYPKTTNPFHTAKRLYAFLGNRNRRAEESFWRSLPYDTTGLHHAPLLELLAKETRWAECIDLFDCYSTYVAQNRSCPCYGPSMPGMGMMSSYITCSTLTPLCVRNMKKNISPCCSRKRSMSSSSPSGPTATRITLSFKQKSSLSV